MIEHSDAADGDGACSVWRLDDNGNEFLVRDGLTEDEALSLVREFEARGHKQAYWVRRRGERRQERADQGKRTSIHE